MSCLLSSFVWAVNATSAFKIAPFVICLAESPPGEVDGLGVFELSDVLERVRCLVLRYVINQSWVYFAVVPIPFQVYSPGVE